MALTEHSTRPRVAGKQYNSDGEDSYRVVYLLGAGATQGCISYSGSRHNLVMSGLSELISKQLRLKIVDKYDDHAGIRRLVNEVVVPEPHLDIEQLITFLEDSPATKYREFADDLRDVFSTVLRSRLQEIEEEPASTRSTLYAALVDMHEVAGNQEKLQGFLTLNYDVLLERAIIDELGREVDYGIAPSHHDKTGRHVTVLKMHGSFGWSRNWPIETKLHHSAGLWIPPGIKKPKNDYPFNIIWGRARELLDCDVLRIIGCNLGPNDWDLVSLIFSTRHTHLSAPPYSVEVISGFETAERIRQLFPYLNVQWLPQLPNIGDQIVGELLASPPRRFDNLSEDLQSQATQKARNSITNPFSYWLTQKGEALVTALGDMSTKSGVFQSFTEEMV